MSDVTTAAAHSHEEHMPYDPVGSKMGMWVFIFTEILLFGALFVMYAIYRFTYQQEFYEAAKELSLAFGTINTVILLISSATIAMSISALQKDNKKLAVTLLTVTIIIGLIFLVNKYFEWGAKFDHGIIVGSETLWERPRGEIVFFGLYFFMTGLHALHIIIGLIFIGFEVKEIFKGTQNAQNWTRLENSGLYWHLVDLIWIYLFPLFYLIH